MLTIGVEALDHRLGGLRPGGFYAVVGPSSTGKSVIGLHFLLTGLERNEHVLLVTRDDTTAIDSRAMFIGYSPGRLTEHPRLRIIRPPAVLPVRHGLAPREALAQWLTEQLSENPPRRIVLDNVGEVESYSTAPHALVSDLVRFFGRTGATTMALLRSPGADGSVSPNGDGALLDPADGVFRLNVATRGRRTFAFERAPAGTFRSDAFTYTLRIGAGFTEYLQLPVPDIDPADRRRVVVLDEVGAFLPEVMTSLGELYEVQKLRSSAGALEQLTAGRYGALIVAVDPFDDARAFDLVYALRKEGNAAPIVLVAPSAGLRSTTRSRGLRMGGDDFFVADLPTAEIVERIQMAWLRGSHRRTALSQIGQIAQPSDGDGSTRPMTRSEFLLAMQTLIAEQPPLFFCYVEFSVPADVHELVWPALRARVRISEGDIVGKLSDTRFACVLDRITPEQTERVMERIRGGHSGLQALTGLVVVPSPLQVEAIRTRLFASSSVLAGIVPDKD